MRRSQILWYNVWYLAALWVMFLMAINIFLAINNIYVCSLAYVIIDIKSSVHKKWQQATIRTVKQQKILTNSINEVALDVD